MNASPAEHTTLDARGYWLPRVGRIVPSPLPLWVGSAKDPYAQVLEVELEPETVQLLHDLTRGAPLLNHTTVVAAVLTVLHLHTALVDVAVGTPPRLAEGGCQASASNVLPIIQTITPQLRFRDLLAEVRRSLLDAFAVQDVPCRPFLEDSLGAGATISTVVALEGFSGEVDEMPELFIRARIDSARARLRLEARGSIALGALQNFADHIARVIGQGVRNQTSPVRATSALLATERQRILVDWNSTAAAVPPGSVISWFEAHAHRQPQAPALVGPGFSQSYGELNRKANSVARYLRRHGVGPEVRVGLHLTRPADMVMALLGVLKAGGAYVPLDPALPATRIEKMIADSQPRIILVDDDRGPDRQLPGETAPLSAIESDSEVDEIVSGICADHLAYMIYTSGTTGEPRGILVPHRGLANAIHYFANRIGINGHSRVSQICSFSFDASALETFLALTCGATLCLAPQEARLSGMALSAFLREYSISVIGAITASVLALIAPEEAPGVRAINVGAEKCPAALADRWGPDRLLLNCYGPTEATIDCACAPSPGGEGDPPIGTPIANSRIYVLDAELQPVPVGAVGEICVGGIPVVRGYSNQAALTAERFVPDPFGSEPGARLYRTGDLGRLRPDQRLDFVRRDDRQVKIDGLRIELGEIDAAIQSHPAVRQSVTEVAADQGERRIVAYFVTSSGQPSVCELRDHLATALPPYMLPSQLIALERLPLTVNGKLDRQALRESALQDNREGAPADPALANSVVERELVRIWGEILGVEPKEPSDNFFDLGGRSLDVTRVMSKVAKAFHVELPLATLFDQPTLAGLATALGRALASQGGSASTLPPLLPLAERPNTLPLSCPQERLWFMHQVLPPEAAALYNGPLPVRLSGPLDEKVLNESFKQIIRRHEILRTAFYLAGQQPAQRVLPEVPFNLQHVDLSNLEPEERSLVAERIAATDARSAFDLGHPPLLRAKLVRLGPEDHVLLVNIHHIVFDGWSSGILLGELSQSYAALSAAEPSPLEPLQLQYADFALWQRRCLEESRFDEQLAYWRSRLAGLPELLLPTNFGRPAVPTYQGEVETFRLPAALCRQLESFGRDVEATLFMTLLAGFKALLFRHTAQTDIVISSPVANRNRAELEGLIGFFVNSLVLRTDLSGNPSFRELLARVRRTTLEAYDHQDVPFERLVGELRPNRVATWNPLFRAAFSLQNVPQPPATPHGLTLTPWETHNRTAKFDLVVALMETEHGLEGDVEYSSELFERERIRELIERYAGLLAGMLEEPDRPLLEIPLAPARTEPASRPEPSCATFEF